MFIPQNLKTWPLSNLHDLFGFRIARKEGLIVESSVGMLAAMPDNFNPQERLYQTWLKWAVVGWMVIIIAFHLGNAVLGKTIYRDIHLGTALEYAKGSI